MISAHYDDLKLVVEGVASSADKAVMKNLGAKQITSDRYLLPGIRASYYRLCRALGKEVDVQSSPSIKYGSFVPDSDSWGRLYDFQREAIGFLTSSRLRGSMMCLSPGLGKTAVSIVSARYLDAKKILVIAPLTLLRTWEREIRIWSDESALLLHGVSDKIDFSSRWVVANYDTVVRNESVFSNQQWDLIVLDESILVKTRSAKRTKVIRKVTANADRVWMLSGSPTSRYLDDLFAQLQILLPKIFTSYWRFAEDYCYIERDQWGWSVVGSRQNIDMQKEFEDIMFVRSMDDVIQLPEELQETVYLDLLYRQKQVYNKLLKEFKAMLASGKEMTVPNRMAQLVRLQQVVSGLRTLDPSGDDVSAKFDAIEELLEVERAEPPVLIWTHWVETGKALHERLSPTWTVARINSDTPLEERQAIIDAFQGGRLQIVIMSIGTGKYGLTLTKAKTIIYCDRSWDADAIFQSSFRVRRIGLDHSPVVISLQCPGTTDELVTSNLIGKFRDIARLTNTDLLALLEQMGGSNA